MDLPTPPPVYERHATVTKVVDGDTLHLDVDLGCDITVAMTVRLFGVNAPEHGTPEGDAATAFVRSWVATWGASPFRLRTVKDKREKYGRYLADLLTYDAEPSLCEALLAAGHAVPYDGGAR